MISRWDPVVYPPLSRRWRRVDDRYHLIVILMIWMSIGV